VTIAVVHFYRSIPENLADYGVLKIMPLESLNRIIISFPPSHPPPFIFIISVNGAVWRASEFYGLKVFSLLQFIPSVFAKSLCGLDVAAGRPTIICTVPVFVLSKVKKFTAETLAPSDNLFETVMVTLRQIYVSSWNESVRTSNVAALGRIILSCDCMRIAIIIITNRGWMKLDFRRYISSACCLLFSLKKE